MAAVGAFFLVGYPYAVHADTAVIEQLHSDATTTISGPHWGTRFTVATTTAVQSIAVAESAVCGTSAALGHMESFGMAIDRVFPLAGPVSGGFRFTGSELTLQAGTTYYLLLGTNPFPCQALDMPVAYTVDVPLNAQIFQINAAGYWNPLTANNFGYAVKDIVYRVCSDSDCSITPAPIVCTPGVDSGCNDNVLFIPGIEASRLYRPDYNGGTEKLWEPFGDSDARDLKLDTAGVPVRDDIYTKDVVDHAYVIGKGNVYQSFISDMSALKTSGKIADWEAIPYDWRLPVETVLSTGSQLPDGRIYYAGTQGATSTPFIEQELRRLAATSRTGKVTIIAHSNGGLVAKALLQKIGDAETAQLVGKLILVASPQLGTPQAIAGLLHGYGLALPSEKFPVALSDATAREAGDTMPGLYALLPSDTYFQTVQDPVATFSTSSLPDWVSKYGTSITDANSQRAFVTDATRIVPAQKDLAVPTVINDTHVTAARALHQIIDAWHAPAGVRVIQIAGWGIPTTVAGINYESRFENGTSSLAETPDFVIDGDGTVVTPSALAMGTGDNVERYWVDLRQYSNDHWAQTIGGVNGLTPFSHANIFEVIDLRTFVVDTLVSSALSLPAYTYLKTATPNAPGTRLRYALHSPLTLNLYDSLGHHTGISTTTGEIDEEIPGTYYAEFGGVKYLFTDGASSTRLVMNGYANGTFTLNVDEYQGDARVASTTFANVPTTASTTVTLDTQLGVSTLSNLSVDQNSDGTPEIVVTPVQNGSVDLDTIAPTTTANTVGPNGSNGWFVGTTTVSLSAIDGGSGVQGTYMSVDGAATTTATSTILSTEGEHLIAHYSRDFAGNTESAHYLTVKIDKTPPEATISFSTTTKAIVVTGADALSTTTVLTTAATSTISDAAGHKLVVLFSKLVPTGNAIAVVSSLAYDGATSTVPMNSLTYTWTTKRGVSSLTEKSTIKGQSCVSGSYTSKSNSTAISYNLVSDSCKTVTKVARTGVDIIYEVTNKGKLNANY